MNFTKEIEDHLKGMGWFLNRQLSKYDNFMNEYNYPEFIKSFIQKYGGLKLKTLNPLQSGYLKNDLLFLL